MVVESREMLPNPEPGGNEPSTDCLSMCPGDESHDVPPVSGHAAQIIIGRELVGSQILHGDPTR